MKKVLDIAQEQKFVPVNATKLAKDIGTSEKCPAVKFFRLYNVIKYSSKSNDVIW